MTAICPGEQMDSCAVQIYWYGAATGIFLNDKGFYGDSYAGDSVYTIVINSFPPGLNGVFLMELRAYDDPYDYTVWPMLEVR